MGIEGRSEMLVPIYRNTSRNIPFMNNCATETAFLPEVLFTMKHDIENQTFQCNMRQH